MLSFSFPNLKVAFDLCPHCYGKCLYGLLLFFQDCSIWIFKREKAPTVKVLKQFVSINQHKLLYLWIVNLPLFYPKEVTKKD